MTMMMTITAAKKLLFAITDVIEIDVIAHFADLSAV